MTSPGQGIESKSVLSMRLAFRVLLPLWTVLFGVAATAAAVSASDPVTDAEAAEFGRWVEARFNSGEPDAVVLALDFHALAERATKDVDVEPALRARFAAELDRASPDMLEAQLKRFNQARFIRVSEVAGEKRVLVRVLAEEGGINFLDFVCGRRASGSVKAVDCFTFVAGELMSETSRRLALPMFASESKGFVEKLSAIERAYVAAQSTLDRATSLLIAAKPVEASALLEALPEEVKTMPSILLIRAQAATGTSDATLPTVLAEWEKLYPNDPALLILSLDAYISRKDFAGALRGLQRLETLTGPDAVLQTLQANVHSMAGDEKAAEAAIRQATKLEPKLEQTYEAWCTIGLRAKRWTMVVDALTELQRVFPDVQIWNRISDDEEWAGFRASAEGKAWRAKTSRR